MKVCFKVLYSQANQNDQMERTHFMMQKREGAILAEKSGSE